MKKTLFLLLILSLNIAAVNAAYLRNVPQTLVQPDGDTLHCFASGDEFHNWLHDGNGFTIIRNVETGYYVYAEKIEGQIVASNHIAGRVNPAEVGLQPNVNISSEEWRTRRLQRELQTPVFPRLRDGSTNHGTLNNLVIFIRFADEDDFTQTFSWVESRFNADDSTTSSLRSYFKKVSYNQLDISSSFYPIQNGEVILSYQDIYPRSYYQPYSAANPNGYDLNDSEDRTEREHSMLARAINAVAPQIPATLDVDFNGDGFVDNIVFIVKGAPDGWNDLLWPHKWELYAQQEPCFINGKQVATFNLQLSDNPSYFNVGVFCHEMNHTLGAPDLYHYYNGTDLAPVGSWDLMGQDGTIPQNMGAYMKYKYGNWISSIPEITECGIYTLHSLGSSDTNNCYKIASPDPETFYILEYRNKNDQYDSSIPTSGLIIYRIDTRYDGCAYYNGSSYFDEVYIFRPNGVPGVNGSVGNAAFGSNLERETFNWQTNPKPFLSDGTVDSAFYIHQVTAAGGDSISFSFCQQNYLTVSPTAISLGMFAHSSHELDIASDMEWTITCNADWLSIDTLSGVGDATLTLSALTENTDPEERTCTLTITASNGFHRDIPVSQLGSTPYLTATLERDTLSNTIGDSTRIYIESNSAWTVELLNDWAVLSRENGLYYDTITLFANELNDNCAVRVGVMTFHFGEESARSIVFRQQGLEAELEITAPSDTIANEVGAQYAFDIHSNAHWTLSSTVSWLSFSATTGDSDATIIATATHTNASATERSTLVRVQTSCGAIDTFRIFQAPAFIHLSENSIGLGCEAGNTYALQVSSSGNWNVKPSSIPYWLEVSPTSGHNADSVFITTVSDNMASTYRSYCLEFKCGAVYDYVNIMQAAVGVAENGRSPILLYPNPAHGQINVTLSQQGDFPYRLLNAQGLLVRSGRFSEGQNKLSLRHLTAGIYFLQVLTNDHSTNTFKIIVE